MCILFMFNWSMPIILNKKNLSHIINCGPMSQFVSRVQTTFPFTTRTVITLVSIFFVRKLTRCDDHIANVVIHDDRVSPITNCTTTTTADAVSCYEG